MSDEKLHIRRCHLCGEVSEREGGLVLRCGHCGKSMAPFFYFDDFKVVADSENGSRIFQEAGDRIPVRGLTAAW